LEKFYWSTHSLGKQSRCLWRQKNFLGTALSVLLQSVIPGIGHCGVLVYSVVINSGRSIDSENSCWIFTCEISGQIFQSTILNRLFPLFTTIPHSLHNRFGFFRKIRELSMERENGQEQVVNGCLKKPSSVSHLLFLKHLNISVKAFFKGNKGFRTFYAFNFL